MHRPAAGSPRRARAGRSATVAGAYMTISGTVRLS